MKKTKSKGILTLIIIGAMIIACIVIIKNNVKEKAKGNIEDAPSNIVKEEFVSVQNGVKVNTSTKLKEAKEVKGYKIENIQLTNQNGTTMLLAEVTNMTARKTEEKFVEITLIDKQGKKLVTTTGIIGMLEAGKKDQISISMQFDYANAYDFKVEIK